MDSAAPPSKTDVLQAIADTLSARRASAALAHHPTLRIQTGNLHTAVARAIERAEHVLDAWVNRLADGAVAPEFRAPSALAPYRIIAPFFVRNVHRISGFLLEEARPAPPVDVDQLAATEPSFSDFVRIGAAVRGFLDALVQAGYQLVTFDDLQLNYRFLQSLLSFATVAPKSLHVNVTSPQLQTALNAYAALTSQQKRNSSFTRAASDQFRQRLRVASESAALPDQRRLNLELIFDFCSDFVHSGYVSVLAIGDAEPGFALGGPGDAFTARAENFAELKHRLLAECAGAYADVLIPALRKAIDRTVATGISPDWSAELDFAAAGIRDVRAILGRRLVEPVRRGLVESGVRIPIDCMCGGHVDLAPPHHEWDRFCPDCGSLFDLFEVHESVDYVLSPGGGIGDVNGGDAPKISTLTDEARAKLKRVAKAHAPEAKETAVTFRVVTDLARCDEVTLAVPSQITSSPTDDDRKRCQGYAFVAVKSLERCACVRIRCGCGNPVEYVTANANHVCQCDRCERVIGLCGISGDGLEVAIQLPDGKPGWAPIQARNRFKEPGVGVD